MSQSPKCNQSGQSQNSASSGNLFTKLYKNHSYLKILVPYLDNLSEEANLSESI